MQRRIRYATVNTLANTQNGLVLINATGGVTIGALTGTAGTVHPTTTAATFTLTLDGSTLNAANTYGGVLANNGSGILALTMNPSLNTTLTAPQLLAATQVLSGANTYTGATTVNSGTLTVTGTLASTAATTINAATPQTATLQIGNAGTTGSIASGSAVTLSGTGTDNLVFNLTNSPTFTNAIASSGSHANISTAGATSVTLSGVISGSGSTFVSGLVTISGTTNTAFNGTLTVSSGTLKILPGGVGTLGTMAVNDGATLSLSNLSLNAGSLNPAGLTVGSTNGGAILSFALNGGNPTLSNVPILLGALTDIGATPTTINVSNSSAQTVGEFPLIKYTGTYTGPAISTAFVLGSLPTARTAAVLDFSTAGLIQLNVTGNDSIIWTGVSSTNWDVGSAVGTGGTFNWKTKSTSSTTNFIQGDSVIFDDSSLSTAVTPGVVTLTQTVKPSSVTFNNSTALAYTLSGTGFAIADNGSTPTLVVVEGTGTVTMRLANTYSGGTTISSGQLNINIASALGTGALTITGGEISNTSGGAITMSGNIPQNWNGSFTFGGNYALNMGAGAITLGSNTVLTTGVGANIAALTVGGAISGTHNLAVAGTGVLTLNGASTGLSGSVTLNSALLNIGNASASARECSRSLADRSTIPRAAQITLANAGMTWNGNFTFVGANTISLASTATVSLAGNSIITINGTAYTAAGTPPAGAIIVGPNSATALTGMISGTSASLSVTGTGTLMLLNGTGTYTGGTTIGSNTGTITVVLGNTSLATTGVNALNALALGTGTITLNAGGVLWVQPENVSPYKDATNPYSYANNFIFNGGKFIGQDGVHHLATGAGATITIQSGGGTIEATWNGKDVYLDGIMSGSGPLLLTHGPTAGDSLTTIHVTNSSNTYSGTVSVSGAGNGVALSVDSATAAPVCNCQHEPRHGGNRPNQRGRRGDACGAGWYGRHSGT